MVMALGFMYFDSNSSHALCCSISVVWYIPPIVILKVAQNLKLLGAVGAQSGHRWGLSLIRAQSGRSWGLGRAGNHYL